MRKLLLVMMVLVGMNAQANGKVGVTYCEGILPEGDIRPEMNLRLEIFALAGKGGWVPSYDLATAAILLEMTAKYDDIEDREKVLYEAIGLTLNKKTEDFETQLPMGSDQATFILHEKMKSGRFVSPDGDIVSLICQHF